MKYKAYWQSPVIDILKKARPPPGKITPISMNCLIILISFLVPFFLSAFCGQAFFAPFGFLKKLLGKRNKRAFSIRIGCERGRKDKPFVFYTTKEGGELYGAIFF